MPFDLPDIPGIENLNGDPVLQAVFAGVFLGALLFVSGLSQAASRKETRSEARNRRMRLVAKGATTGELLAILKPQTRQGPLSRLPFFGKVPELLSHAGLTVTPGRFLAICTALAGAAFLAASARLALPQAAAAAFGVGYVLPVIWLRGRARKRTEALVSQLPDALDLMARGLKVGHPLGTTIQSVAEEMEDPVATEFGIVFDQISYGDDLPDAFAEFADRVDVEDVRYLAASIGIQHGTGGDLARVIDVLAGVIRGRITMRRKINAISSEGRLTAYFLSALPFLIFGMTMITSPDYYRGIMDDPLAPYMAGAIVMLVVLNALVLTKLVKFRI